MADWFGIFDVLLNAVSATRTVSNADEEKAKSSEEVEETVKKRTDAIVEKRLSEINKRREKSHHADRQDHYRMKR